jgi:hypothetical protein
VKQFREDPYLAAKVLANTCYDFGYDCIIIDIDTCTLAEAMGSILEFPEHEPARVKDYFLKSMDDVGNLPVSKYTRANLDVKQWVHTAKLVGMSYAVLTAKHKSGVCLWDSKVMWTGKEYDYDVANSNYKTDVVAKFMAACLDEGIKPGLYYCISDPHNEGTQDGYA